MQQHSKARQCLTERVRELESTEREKPDPDENHLREENGKLRTIVASLQNDLEQVEQEKQDMEEALVRVEGSSPAPYQQLLEEMAEALEELDSAARCRLLAKVKRTCAEFEKAVDELQGELGEARARVDHQQCEADIRRLEQET